MTFWDPDRYLDYEDHRTRPAIDLLAGVRGDFSTIWDLGCGTGSITAMLRDRWPDGAVHGLDSSPEMLEAAREIAGIDWVLGDIEAWEPGEPVDLVFSNAALQWLPDHRRLLPRLFHALSESGTLAMQMPRNYDGASHTLLAEVAQRSRWRDEVGHLVPKQPVAEPGWYHELLAPLSASLDVWEIEYQQALTGPSPVLEWTRATAAAPFINALGADAEDFLAEYGAELSAAYPRRDDGVTLFPFRRLFIVATPDRGTP